MAAAIFFSLAAAVLICIPFTPQLIRLRIRFMRWLHWQWAARLLEDYFDVWVLCVRTLLFVIAAVFIIFGWRSL